MGTEHRLLVVPPDPAKVVVVVSTELAGSACGDPAVHQDQFEPSGDDLPGQVLQHQFAGPVLVGGGRHDEGTYGQPGHVDRHDALGTLCAAARAAAVMEGEPAVGRLAGQVCVDDHHRRGRIGPSVCLAGGRMQDLSARAQVPLRDQRRNCDRTRVQGPNDSGRSRRWQPVWEM